PGLVPPHVPADRTHVYHKYRLRLDPAALGLRVAPAAFRDRLLAALRAEGVEVVLWQTLPLPAHPVFQEFLANGRRIPAIAALRGKPFPNHHLDSFFNATVDAALVLGAFISAAEAVGLGCCPISLIRDHAAVVSSLFELPERVIPVAGLTVGWPAEQGELSPRLSLASTVHRDRYDERNFVELIEAYDRRRADLRPYPRQRDEARWGTAAFYSWSEDKARQYAMPQRADFGAFIRAKGFCLD
ncbi:MAG: nitroreductase family protein, partial [Dehalococcoidia bacterium]|nr:nitroreductase family protein [Dehalococcoidia bacterium]